jgi:hypothetical protein
VDSRILIKTRHVFSSRDQTFSYRQRERMLNGMETFKCPYCRTEYEMMTAHLAFQQRSYAKCQVCYRTMYSWASRNVPVFTLLSASDGEATDVKL